MSFNYFTLGGLFLAGLALNLTPCVYPMLSVTVSLFGASKEGRLAGSFANALTYVMGIAFMYSSIGVVAGLTGGFFGTVLQSVLVQAGLALVIFALALGMFGVYELQAPAAVLGWLSGPRARGFLGFFLSGLLVGIFAAPCIGPPIVALLATIGSRGDPVWGFWAFFVMSLGLGLPYLILGTFTGLLGQLPRSGVWMVWVKKVFGVVLLGLSAFYLVLAVDSRWLPWVVPLTLTAGGVYLGFFEASGNDRGGFRRFKAVAGALAVVVGLAIPLSAGRSSASVIWEPYTHDRMSQARAGGKPVVIDVFADWCIPCHELERYTYTDAEVIRALDPYVRLKLDVTNPSSPLAREVTLAYRVVGVPTIMFFAPDGQEIRGARIVGFVPPEAFLEAVRLAGDG